MVLRESQRGGRVRLHGGRALARPDALPEAADDLGADARAGAGGARALSAAPPHWVAGLPFAMDRRFIRAHCATRPPRRSACTLRPRADRGRGALAAAAGPAGRPTLLYPPLVFVVIRARAITTSSMRSSEPLRGCGFAAAQAIHGPLPRGSSTAGRLRIALAGAAFGLVAFLINGGFVGELI